MDVSYINGYAVRDDKARNDNAATEKRVKTIETSLNSSISLLNNLSRNVGTLTVANIQQAEEIGNAKEKASHAEQVANSVSKNINSYVDALRRADEALQDKIDEINARIDDMETAEPDEGETPDTPTGDSASSEELLALEARVSTVEQATAAHTADITDLEAELAALQAAKTAIEERLAALEAGGGSGGSGGEYPTNPTFDTVTANKIIGAVYA